MVTPLRKITDKQLGELLIEKGLITKEQLDRALGIQKEKGGLIGEILVALGYVEETNVALALTSQYGLPYLPLESYEIDSEIVKIIPEHIARRYLLLPIDKFGKNLSIAMSNPLNNAAIEEVESIVGCNVQIFVSTSSDVRKAIDKYYKTKDK
jgi:type IV pilus assembly protein PilB